jgi:redox-sensitive bicupin YhaK (pirin superfamily)
VRLAVIAGRAFGMESPVRSAWPTFYVDASLAPGASLVMPAQYEERAVYCVEGEVSIDGAVLGAGTMAVLDAASGRVTARTAARLMLLGGARFQAPRYLWWNFVASSRERIEAAKRRWRQGEFAAVPGESEFIPLPLQ